MRYMTTTKNLFPTSTVVGTLGDWDQSTARQFEEDKWYIGISYANYYLPTTISSYELTETYVYMSAANSGYGIGKAFKCEPNQTYTASCRWIKNTSDMILTASYYDENGNYLSNDESGYSAENYTFTTPANCKWFTICFIPVLPGSTYIYDIQLEEGSSVTPYVPNGYLPMYKGRYKVNDVCQLLNKSEFAATQTKDGVTFTNNGDGTITVNGTAISRTTFVLANKDIAISKGNKVLLNNPLDVEAYDKFWIEVYLTFVDGTYLYIADTRLAPLELTKDVNSFMTFIVVGAGETVNATVTPQFYNLTEMYGAGNEPTTIAEFKEKFPDDFYPYSPYCWAKIKQMRYMTTTKNLLANIEPSGNTRVENGVVYQINADASESNYLKVQLYNGNELVEQIAVGSYQQIGKNIVTFTTGVLPEYTRLAFGLNGSTIDTKASSDVVLEDNTTYTLSMDFINITQGKIAWTNTMLEKGSTATSYVPHGYLPLK